jgi:hypothetical protein
MLKFSCWSWGATPRSFYRQRIRLECCCEILWQLTFCVCRRPGSRPQGGGGLSTALHRDRFPRPRWPAAKPRRGKSVLAAGCSAVAIFPVPRVCTDTTSRRQSVGDFSTNRRRPRAELMEGPRWPGGPWPLIDGRALVRIQTLIETLVKSKVPLRSYRGVFGTYGLCSLSSSTRDFVRCKRRSITITTDHTSPKARSAILYRGKREPSRMFMNPELPESRIATQKMTSKASAVSGRVNTFCLSREPCLLRRILFVSVTPDYRNRW